MFAEAGCALMPSASTHHVRLAEDGKALADIVVAADADKAARFGALELAWHLKEMTGADFRIITDAEPHKRFEICVGPSRRSKYKKTDFEGQHYIVEISAKGMYLCGLDKEDKTDLDYRHTDQGIVLKGAPGYCEQQGSMYAVYDFLENILGVEWFEQSDFGTKIPKRTILEVNCAKTWKEPFCLSRTGSWSGGSYNTILWKSSEPNYSKYWDLAFGSKKRDQRSAQTRLFLYRHRMGGVHRSANHSFYDFYDKYLNKNSKTFREYKPDWFSKGTSDAAQPAQLCYTNPEVIDEVIRNVRAYFDDPDPKHKRWGEDQCCLEPMDNASFCLCDNCRKWYEPERGDDSSSHSTYWFNFVNTVAREIKKSHPDKRIATLAYMSHEGPPTGFRLEDNVTVWFCLFNNRLPFERSYDRAFERMATWRAEYPDLPLALWLYNTFPYEFAHLANFKTFPGFFSHFAADQYKFFKKMDARQGIYQCGIAGTLESWMQLELLQNADLTADELLDRWYSQYGAAAGAMRKFHDLCEERYCSRTIRPKDLSGICQESSWGYVGDEATMNTLAGFIAEADSHSLTADERGRLELFKLDTWAYMREGSSNYLKMTKTPYPRYHAERIADAGGDFAKVDWAKLSVTNQPLYISGQNVESKFTTSVRAAHDGKFLYFEITHDLDTSKLIPCQAISYWDDIELMFARQLAKPYRCWFVAPDGRWYAASWGEVNGKSHVVPEDLYGSKFMTDISNPDKWVNRWIIPLNGLAAEAVKPGETIYLNAASTLGPHFSGPGTRFGVYTLTSYTYVHVPDRMATLTLAP